MTNDGTILSQGENFTINGPLVGALSYVQRTLQRIWYHLMKKWSSRFLNIRQFTQTWNWFRVITRNVTAQCGEEGSGCLIVETTLHNPSFPGLGSGTDLSLIFPWVSSQPHAIRVRYTDFYIAMPSLWILALSMLHFWIYIVLRGITSCIVLGILTVVMEEGEVVCTHTISKTVHLLTDVS